MHESSEILSSIDPNLGEAIPVSAQACLYNLAAPSLRTRIDSLKCLFIPWELSLPIQTAHVHGQENK